MNNTQNNTNQDPTPTLNELVAYYREHEDYAWDANNNYVSLPREVIAEDESQEAYYQKAVDVYHQLLLQHKIQEEENAELLEMGIDMSV